MTFIKNLKYLSLKDVSVAGGKGASLGEMCKTINKQVPKGFVVLASAFDVFFKENELHDKINALLKQINLQDINQVNDLSRKIKKIILKADLSKNISEEIQKEFSKMKTQYVAVRSSATVEDSSTASWAGELESYLNTTEKDIILNVKKRGTKL